MSFSSEAKAELCQQRPDKKCCALAESYGVLLYCNTFSAQEIRIITASPEFAARLPRLFHRAFRVGFDRTPEELIRSADCILQDHVQGAKLRYGVMKAGE